MRVLSFDTAGPRGGLALISDGTPVGSTELRPPGSYAESILVALDGLLAAAGLLPDDIDLVVVAAGPGSFTGLRIGIAAAQGFAFGLGKPVVAVPSTEVLAAWARVVVEDRGGAYAGLIDAHRGEVYYAAYRPAGPELELVIPPGAARPEELRKALEPVLPEEREQLVLCGDGVPVVASEMAVWPETVKTVFPPLGAQAAALLARLGALRYARRGADTLLEPLYIRPADARKPVPR